MIRTEVHIGDLKLTFLSVYWNEILGWNTLKKIYLTIHNSDNAHHSSEKQTLGGWRDGLDIKSTYYIAEDLRTASR